VEVAHRPVETIYFPYSGVISIVARTGNKQHEAEAAVIGYEGMTGLPVVLGTELVA
jgi:predicted amino acid dehydrogenase